ncbi:DUF6053 domain-containing protein [Lysobacter sp. TAB13]
MGGPSGPMLFFQIASI